jgi:hypothetical protein
MNDGEYVVVARVRGKVELIHCRSLEEAQSHAQVMHKDGATDVRVSPWRDLDETVWRPGDTPK